MQKMSKNINNMQKKLQSEQKKIKNIKKWKTKKKNQHQNGKT